jgi:hypothetical protein
MEYKIHQPVSKDAQEELIKKFANHVEDEEQ